MVLLEIAQDKMVASNKVKVSFGIIKDVANGNAPYYVQVMDNRSGIEVSKKLRYFDQTTAANAYAGWLASPLADVDSLLGIPY